VSFFPDQFFSVGTSIVGERFDSDRILRYQIDGAAFPSAAPPECEAPTDATGTAVIRNLLPGGQPFLVTSDAFVQPIRSVPARKPARRESEVVIGPGKEISSQVRMEPEGSTSLSAAIQSSRQER
jgi:hypothetical protein